MVPAIILPLLVTTLISPGHGLEVADSSRTISVAWVGGHFQVLPGINYYDSVVAWANFTDDQRDNGWMYLEISTNDRFPDQVVPQTSIINNNKMNPITKILLFRFRHWLQVLLKDI